MEMTVILTLPARTTPPWAAAATADPPTPAADPVSAVWQALSIDSTPAVMEEQEYPVRQAPWHRRLLALGEVLYTIRLPETSGEAECARCGTRFRAAGPTGHANDEPICDICLLECEEELGMVLALVAVVRGFSTARCETAEEHWEALEEVGAFARIYERVAARSGPPRMILPDSWLPKA